METLGERVAYARELRELSQAQLGKAAGGIRQQSIDSIEKGASRRTGYLLDIAAALRVSPYWLQTGEGGMESNLPPDNVSEVRGMKVEGHVQAGEWQLVDSFGKEDLGYIDVPTPEVWEGHRKFALQVRGDSMNRHYPHGSHVICVSAFDIQGMEPMDGDHVVVERRRDSFEVEATVKELRILDNGEAWLVPKSDRPGFEDIRYDPDDNMLITGLVITFQAHVPRGRKPG